MTNDELHKELIDLRQRLDHLQEAVIGLHRYNTAVQLASPLFSAPPQWQVINRHLDIASEHLSALAGQLV